MDASSGDELEGIEKMTLCFVEQVMIPLGKIATVEPVTMKENPPEKYVHIVTVDSHDFWFMGFVSYDKAVHNLVEAVSQRSQSQHGVGVATAGSK